MPANYRSRYDFFGAKTRFCTQSNGGRNESIPSSMKCSSIFILLESSLSSQNQFSRSVLEINSRDQFLRSILEINSRDQFSSWVFAPESNLQSRKENPCIAILHNGHSNWPLAASNGLQMKSHRVICIVIGDWPWFVVSIQNNPQLLFPVIYHFGNMIFVLSLFTWDLFSWHCLYVEEMFVSLERCEWRTWQRTVTLPIFLWIWP